MQSLKIDLEVEASKSVAARNDMYRQSQEIEEYKRKITMLEGYSNLAAAEQERLRATLDDCLVGAPWKRSFFCLSLKC